MLKGVTGLDHIGVPTADMEASCAFYESLGFTKAAEFGLGGRKFFFYQAGSLLIELIPAGETVKMNGAVDHFALRVDDVEEAYAFCKEQGYTILNDRIMSVNFWENGMKCFNIEGPNKEKIEFCQKL